MKYLLLIKVRNGAQITPELLKTHKRWVNEQMQKGVAESGYVFAGTPDGMCIVNADSHEQLTEFCTASPAFGVCELDIRPLADFSKQMDRLVEVLNRSGAYR